MGRKYYCAATGRFAIMAIVAPGHRPAQVARLPSEAAHAATRKDLYRVEDMMQYGLLFSAWIVAFMLGKELQVGFAQWRARRRSQ
jgi:hypothetical protein